MVAGFSHTGFVVQDVARMTAFYRDVIGLSVLREAALDGDLASEVTGFDDAIVNVVFLGRPQERHMLELVQYINPAGGDAHGARNDAGCAHVCFTVDDIAATYERLIGQGVQFAGPPVRMGTLLAANARDPEGNWIEFIELLSQP
jgi:catechol 2,3-dioxygenase-like lactoylglutathione lyase family enzyme